MSLVRSRHLVAARTEPCRSVEKVLDGAVFELPDVVVLWSTAEVDIFHFTFLFGFSDGVALCIDARCRESSESKCLSLLRFLSESAEV